MTEAYLSLNPHSANIDGIAVDPTQNRFQVSWNERGVDVHVPPARYVWRAVRHSFWRSTDKVAAMIYPVPFGLVALAAAGSCVYVWRAPADAPLLTHPWSKSLLYLNSILPSTRLVPERHQAAVLCGKVWALVFGGATVIHRFFLRRMLTYKGWLLEKNPQKPGAVTRLWSAVLQLCFIRTGIKKTDVYERCLPSLPLPSLQQTVSKYLASVRAVYHQGDDLSDWIEVRRTAESFLLNEGPSLQRHLRLHHFWRPNYVTEWWTRNVILSARAGLALYSNYFTIPFAAFTPTTIPEARAAVLTYNLVRLKQRLERRALPPLFTGPRGSVPISMEQLYLAFNTTRIPGREVDRIDHDDSDENSHVVVLSRGHIYQVPVRHPRTRKWLTPYQLEAVYKTILEEVEDDISTGRDESEEEESEPQSAQRTTKRRMYRLAESLLPALTAAPRSQWADIRSTFLLNDANNHKPLRAIEKALFVVSFDDRGGTVSKAAAADGTGGIEGLDAECARYLVGNGSNLWCDKSFNLVVRHDGRVGAHVEHSWCDAASFMSFLEYVTGLEEAEGPYDAQGHAKRMPQDGKISREDLEYILTPKRLRFTLHRQLAASIREAHTSLLTEVVSQLDLHVVRFDRYGKNLPKLLGLGPDSWMQMAIQLAYYLEHDCVFKQTYESVLLRTFARGRTEAVRSVSDESAAFVRAMAAPSAGEGAEKVQGATPKSRAELLALLRAACEHHQELAQEASAGQGIDRHLFALYMVSAAKEVPSDFLNNVMRKTKWKVSSQQMRQRHLPVEYHAIADARPFETPGCGFGPVAYDGYGVSYTYCDEGVLYITVTCKKGCTTTSAKGFSKRIVWALEAMAELSEVDVSTLPRPALTLEEIPEVIRNSEKRDKFPW